MANWERETRQSYEQKGFASRSGFGRKPALLIVDFINGFTDPTTPLGGDFARQLEVTNQLSTAFRRLDLPVVYTTIAYGPDLRDGGMFVKKVPSLGILLKGSRMVEVDDRIRPERGDHVVEKKFASSFFGTQLDGFLNARGVDTVVMTGCTTSGCIRASAIDSMQYGFHTVVVRDGVGDRAEGPHEANLFDIDAKYGDVVMAREVLDYLDSLGPASPANSGDFEARARANFQSWWRRDQQAAE